LIVSSKVALQNHSIVRVQTVAERQSLFFFCLLFFFQQKESNEKDDSILSLPNGNLFFLLPAFLFQQKNQMKKMILYFLCERQSFSFCLLFLFQQKETR